MRMFDLLLERGRFVSSGSTARKIEQVVHGQVTEVLFKVVDHHLEMKVRAFFRVLVKTARCELRLGERASFVNELVSYFRIHAPGIGSGSTNLREAS
jgi:hypothetical protein